MHASCQEKLKKQHQLTIVDLVTLLRDYRIENQDMFLKQEFLCNHT